MHFLLLLAVLPVIGYVSAAPTPSPKDNLATAQCITHLEGLPAQLNTLTSNLTPDKAVGSIDGFQSAHKKAVDYCCQASVDASKAITQSKSVAPQLKQALDLLGNVREVIPNVGGIQDKFTQLPDSLLECSKKYI